MLDPEGRYKHTLNVGEITCVANAVAFREDKLYIGDKAGNVSVYDLATG